MEQYVWKASSGSGQQSLALFEGAAWAQVAQVGGGQGPLSSGTSRHPGPLLGGLRHPPRTSDLGLRRSDPSSPPAKPGSQRCVDNDLGVRRKNRVQIPALVHPSESPQHR